MEIDLTPSGWQRMTMAEAVKEYAGIDFDGSSTPEEALEAVKAKGIEI